MIVTFKHKYADWQAVFNPFYPASTNKDPEDLQRRLEGRAADHRRPVQARQHRSARRRRSRSCATRSGGATRQSSTRSSSASSSPTRRSTRWPTARSTRWTSGPTPTSTTGRRTSPNAEIRVAGGPNFRHITINGTEPEPAGRQGASGAGDGDRPDRASRGRCSVRSASTRSRSTTTSSWRTRPATRTTPARSASTTRTGAGSCSTRPAGSSTATSARRTASRSRSPASFRRAVATSRQESELIQNMLGQIGVTLTINTVPSDDFFDKYITPGQFDFTVFSWIGTPYPDQLVEIDLCEADDERQGRAGHPAELRPRRIRRDRSALRPGDPGTRSARRRSSWPIASTR